MTKRRLSIAGAETVRRLHLRAIGIVLDAQSIQRSGDYEFRLSTADVAKMSGLPEYVVRRIGRDHFTAIEVPGRVVGYDRGEFYVADDEATAKRRAFVDSLEANTITRAMRLAQSLVSAIEGAPK